VGETTQRTADGRGVTTAVVHVETGKLHALEAMLQEYGERVTPKGLPRNRALFDTVRDIRAAALRSFWTDPADEFPDETQTIWWEVWLRADIPNALEQFREVFRTAGARYPRMPSTFRTES